MVSIASRTAYVLLSSVEDEFRSIVDTFAGDDEPTLLLGDELLKAALERRRRDGGGGVVVTLQQLTPYLDFQDAYDLSNRIRDRLPTQLADGLRSLAKETGRVVAVRNRVAHNRPLEIDDLPTVVDFTAALEVIEGWRWDKVRETRTEIRDDPSYIFRVAANLITDPDSAVPNNLPAPDFDETSLLGRKEERRQIIRAIRGSWPVISILGDGGIGKTALALQVCYDVAQQADCPFEAIVWVTAKNAQLTSTEIVRIESAVEDSLGLFASATAALGEPEGTVDPISDLLDVLGIFPTLLVLDNVETILDEHFPAFLRDIPSGSKVLITSRIGVKTENPYKLAGLSVDDAKRLMRITARARGLDIAAVGSDDELGEWAQRMSCHPAYIKWFISGLQAGQSPERLLSENGLVLDFCMSNVFDFLGESSRAALRAMVVVPGSHTMAELAFLTGFNSAQIQEVVLELTTTNFVTQVRGGASGTALELSDFARQYLRRTLEIAGDERFSLTEKQRQLYAVGGGLLAAHALDPYSVDTIDIRGVGDYSAAKQLREALELCDRGRFDEALRLCAEAAELAPGYHEAARVEASIHERATNFGEAHEAYSRAKDLAPNDPHVAHSLGSFLVSSGFHPAQGVRELQRAAKLDPASPVIQLAICEAHIVLGDLGQAVDAAAYAVEAAEPSSDSRKAALFAMWRACAYGVQQSAHAKDWPVVAEMLEYALGVWRPFGLGDISFESLDYLLWISELSEPGAADPVEKYIASRIAGSIRELEDVRRSISTDHFERRVGTVDTTTERGFGFLKASDGSRFYVHARALWDRREFESLVKGSVLVFRPGPTPESGNPEALSVNWVG